jgi:hypothetical protein
MPTGSFLESYSDSDANEHRKQPACLVSGFTGMRKDEEKDIEDEYNCAGGNTDIAVANGLLHSVSIFQCRQLISKIAQECVDTGEESTQTSADIADRQRLSFEVGSRKTRAKPQIPAATLPRTTPAPVAVARASVTAVSGPTCASVMAAMLAAFDAPVARGMCRLPHFFASGFADSAA